MPLTFLKKLVTKQNFWRQASQLQPEVIQLAVNEPRLLKLSDQFAPPVRLIELSTSRTSKIQWIGQKDISRQKFKLLEGEFDLGGAAALSEMLQFNTMASTLILQALESLRELINESMKAHSEDAQKKYSDEARAIEWMRVSFDLLKKAIESCPREFASSNDVHFFSQSLIIERSTDARSISLRLLCFNLDITFKIEREQELQVVIYNHKDGESQRAALNAKLLRSAPQALDLLAGLIEASKKHFYWPLDPAQV